MLSSGPIKFNEGFQTPKPKSTAQNSTQQLQQIVLSL